MTVFHQNVSRMGWEEVRRRQLHRLPLVAEWMEWTRMSAGSRVLDIGPGPGVFFHEYVQRAGETGAVWALEKWEEAAEVLRAVYKDVRHVTIVQGDAEKDGAGMEQAEIILVTDVLHHTDEPMLILQNIARHIRPGAQVLIAEFDPQGDGLIGPPLSRRIGMEAMEAMAAAAGLVVQHKHKQAYEHYCLLAVPPEI